MPTTTLAAIRALPDCGVDLDQIPDNVPHGGYASIFFGRLRATGERVAVKVLGSARGWQRRPAAGSPIRSRALPLQVQPNDPHPDGSRMGDAEEAALRRLNDCAREHLPPGVPKLFFAQTAVVEGMPWHYLVTEAVGDPADPAADWWFVVDRGAATDEAALGRIFTDIVIGLLYSHACGVAHLDVKPANVRLSPCGAKLIDFGLSLVDVPVTARPGGTPPYMSPQIVRNARSASLREPCCVAKADVWALGISLLAAAAGFHPWQLANMHEGSGRYRRVYNSQRQPHLGFSTTLLIFSTGCSNVPPPSFSTDPSAEMLFRLLDGVLVIDPASRPDMLGVCELALPWLHAVCPAAAERLTAVTTAARLASAGGADCGYAIAAAAAQHAPPEAVPAATPAPERGSAARRCDSYTRGASDMSQVDTLPDKGDGDVEAEAYQRWAEESDAGDDANMRDDCMGVCDETSSVALFRDCSRQYSESMSTLVTPTYRSSSGFEDEDAEDSIKGPIRGVFFEEPRALPPITTARIRARIIA